MKLINNQTGQVLEYVKTMRSEQKTVYKLYANGILYKNRVMQTNDMVALNLEILIPESNYTQFHERLGVESLKQSFTGFTEQENDWIFETGSTGMPTTVRVFIPSDLFAKTMYTGNYLDMLIQAMSPLKDFTTRNEAGIVQYLEELLPEHKAIIEMYADFGVLIEYKN